MTEETANRIYDRIRELAEDISAIKVSLARLEVARKYSSRWIALGSHAVVGIVVGLVVAFFGK